MTKQLWFKCLKSIILSTIASLGAFVVCALGWVGKGVMRVRAAPQTKIFQKVLDKCVKVCYNNYTKRKER